ncbi:uncharacterized protein J7T54_006490 [Emericellopsis cladophorae]|uniref:Uncharacterized protein n=1 Tax=Emericellopsis cladophorae TaxID=2686198 RepID=A0A9Q0BH75_9HYPO|nr:uncharacterized protein J7T54_006490 [Emericellopsis cladophorae]KAI6784445.1 hypothetical protein J7T54_006490 [Emericellopsis cladophorae]
MSASLDDLRDLSPADDEKDEVDSLPSIATSDIYSDASLSDSDAQEEWDRSLEQLQLMLTMMIIPFVGKYFGRKFAYWSWGKYMYWLHGVDIKFTNKKAFKAAGAIEAASSL